LFKVDRQSEGEGCHPLTEKTSERLEGFGLARSVFSFLRSNSHLLPPRKYL